MNPLEFQTATLKDIVIHYVGNKNAAEPLRISTRPPQVSEEEATQLLNGLLFRFKGMGEQFSFHHPSSLQYHALFQQCKGLFDASIPFEEVAATMARQLYEASGHPKVKGGELYVVHLEGIPVNSRMHAAIGLFKTESKSLFLDVQQDADMLELHMREGAELSRIDKGCLILNRDEENGYEVMLFDNQNRGEEALYWKEGFLGLAARKNEFHHTAHFLSLTKQFITGHEEEDLAKTEQAALLQRSLDYFKGHDSFDIDEFQEEVFGNEDTISSFRDFGARYVQSHDYDIAAQFDISPEAVKKQARIYKSVLKLDRNFHIYIHGRTDLIEKGTDDDGRKFYKIYYQEES